MKKLSILFLFTFLFTNYGISQNRFNIELNPSINIVEMDESHVNYKIGINLTWNKTIIKNAEWVNSIGINYANLQYVDNVSESLVCYSTETSIKKLKTNFYSGINYHIHSISIMGQIGVNYSLKQYYESNLINESFMEKTDVGVFIDDIVNIRNPKILFAYRIILGYNFEINNRALLVGVDYINTPFEVSFLKDQSLGLTFQFALSQ